MKLFSLLCAEEVSRASFDAKLRHSLGFLGAAVLIAASGNTYAASLSFLFSIPLELLECRESYCDSSSQSPSNAVIFIELDVADPTEEAQTWGDEDVVSWHLASGFPSLSPVGELLAEHSFGGTYASMPGTELTIGTLEFYEINNKDMAGDGRSKIYGTRWELRDAQGKVVMVPDQAHMAYANVGEVPLPAAAWLFGTALIGLGLLKRRGTQ